MIAHSVTVKRLRELLTELQDDDVLFPNEVRNLLIIRGQQSIGFINLLEDLQQIELWGNEDEDDL